jgi:hypothetical protein
VLSGLLLLRPFLWRSLLILLAIITNFVVGESLLLDGAFALLLKRDSVLLLVVNRGCIVWTISSRIGTITLLWRWLSHQKVIFPLSLLCIARLPFLEIKVLGCLFVLTVLWRCRRYVFLHVHYVSISGTVSLSNRLSSANLLSSQLHLV